jgi:pimeloyl-ACP methyl ester carboxylesterase
MPTLDRFFVRGSFKLFYRHTVVDQHGPTYVLLHGWSGNNTAFVPLMRLLHQRGINTIVPDLRGHGLSNKHRVRAHYKLEEFVEDLHALLIHVGVRPVTMLGYSAGGTIALAHEQRYPGWTNNLILISANHDNPLKYWGIRWFTPVARALFLTGAKLARFERRKVYKDLNLVKINGYWGSVYQGLRSMPMDVNIWLLASYAELRLQDLSRVTVPTLILRGRGDRFFTLREAHDLKRKLHNAPVQMRTVADAGHYLVTHHEEQLHATLHELVFA